MTPLFVACLPRVAKPPTSSDDPVTATVVARRDDQMAALFRLDKVLAHRSSQGDHCRRICNLHTDICGQATRICDAAKAAQTNARAAQTCEAATKTCKETNQRIPDECFCK